LEQKGGKANIISFEKLRFYLIKKDENGVFMKRYQDEKNIYISTYISAPDSQQL
jgi:hypothetical protein